MTVAFALLGFLAGAPQSGYDLKKRLAASESLHWSGNNNQVYRALTELHRDGLVSQEVQEPRDGPARKVYALTRAGRGALREWIRAETEPPEFHSPIVVKLLGAQAAPAADRDAALAAYAEQLRVRLLALAERARRDADADAGAPPRRAALRRLIEQHAEVHHRAELNWVRSAQRALAALPEGA